MCLNVCALQKQQQPNRPVQSQLTFNPPIHTLLDFLPSPVIASFSKPPVAHVLANVLPQTFSHAQSNTILYN